MFPVIVEHSFQQIFAQPEGGAAPAAGGGAPPAGATHWYRKNIGITEGAGGVSEWADQVGSIHLSQATEANRPTKEAGGTITFNGSTDVLTSTSSFAIAQPFTLYLRFKIVTWVDSDTIYRSLSGTSDILVMSTASPQILLDTNPDIGPQNAAAIGSFGSYCIVCNGASSVLRINGDEYTGDTGSDALGTFDLGAFGGSLHSNIEVAEILVYETAHDASTRTAGIAYLDTL